MQKIEKLIEEFWACSIAKDFSNYPFEDFFSIFERQLKEKLALHGVLAFDEYVKFLIKYYDLKILKKFVYFSKHTNRRYSLENITKSIFLPRYKNFRKIYLKNKYYVKLLTLFNELLQRNGLSKSEKVLLADKCIHAEHDGGKIINYNIEKMRAVYDEKIENLCIDKMFGILNRNGVEEKIRHIKNGFNAVFIDFNDVHLLNNKMGYQEVNKLFAKLFRDFEFRKTDIVGRWFSGDEIIIVTQEDDVKSMLERFQKHASKYNVTFRYKIFKNIKSLEEMNSKIMKAKE